MKKSLVVIFLMLFVTALFTLPALAAKDGKGAPIKGKEVSVSGKLSCTFCGLSHPGKTCPPGCCENCIKAGDPPLLTDAKGNHFILVTGEHEVPLMTPERQKMLGGSVTVKGVKVQGKGVQVIYVDEIKAK